MEEWSKEEKSERCERECEEAKTSKVIAYVWCSGYCGGKPLDPHVWGDDNRTLCELVFDSIDGLRGHVANQIGLLVSFSKIM